ncbi:MAG TPA: hypothetical protein VIC06_00820 [Solirubrobacteraceae bacterium]
MTDFLDEKRDEIDHRLTELKPLVEEYNRLQAAAAALRGVDGSSMGVVMSAPSLESSVVSLDGSGVEGVADAENESLSASASEPSSADPGPGLVSPAIRRGPGRPRGSGSGSSRSGEDNGGDVSSGDDTEADDSSAAAAPSVPRASGTPRRAGRPKGSGTRAAEALRIVREHPGVTIPELADRMGIKQNYLYRVLPELVQEGKVAKQGRGWHPRAA